MSLDTGYECFAEFYDTFMQVDYARYAKTIDSLVKRYGNGGRYLLDLACGTGALCEKLYERGYTCTGIDSSLEMLNIAVAHCGEMRSPITYIEGDICQFDFSQMNREEFDGDNSLLDYCGTQFDIITCTLDSLNHLEGEEEIVQCFTQVARHLARDGIFIFDMNTPHKHMQFSTEFSYIDESDKVFFAWWTSECGRAEDHYSVEHTLMFFVNETGYCFPNNPDDTYHRYEETVIEFAYTEEELLRMLKESGLECVAQFDGDDFEADKAPHGASERVLYVVRRVTKE